MNAESAMAPCAAFNNKIVCIASGYCLMSAQHHEIKGINVCMRRYGKNDAAWRGGLVAWLCRKDARLIKKSQNG